MVMLNVNWNKDLLEISQINLFSLYNPFQLRVIITIRSKLVGQHCIEKCIETEYIVEMGFLLSLIDQTYITIHYFIIKPLGGFQLEERAFCQLVVSRVTSNNNRVIIEGIFEDRRLDLLKIVSVYLTLGHQQGEIVGISVDNLGIVIERTRILSLCIFKRHMFH